MGLLIGQGAIYLFTPAMTRLYTTAEIGLAGSFLAIASIVGTVSTLRLELLIPSAGPGEGGWITRRAIRSIIVVGIASGVVFYALSSGTMVVEALLFSLAVAGIGGTALSMQLSARHNVLGGVAFSKAGQGLTQVFAQFLAAVLSVTQVGLQLGYAIGYCCGAAIQTLSLRRNAERQPVIVPPVARKIFFRKQTLLLSSAALLNILTVWMYPLLTLVYFGADEAGELTIAQRLAVAPVSLVVASLTPVILAQVGAMTRDGGSARSIVFQWLKRLLPLGVFVSVVLLVIPEPWISAVLGNQWGGVGTYLAAMALMMGAQLVAGPLSQVLVLQGRSKAQFVWDAARLVGVLAATSAVAVLSRDPVAMILAASIVLAFFYVVYLFLVLRDFRPRPKSEAIGSIDE